MSRGPTARSIAETVLARVVEDDAFASAVLEAEIERHPQLEVRDRALATELVYGTLRVHPWLEKRLDVYASRSVTRLRPRVRAALALAAYQIYFLDRVPAYAAVSEAVAAVRAVSGEKVSGFANAILRKVAGEAERGRPPFEEAVRASAAPWLVHSLESALGRAGASAMLAFGADAPPLGLRARTTAERDAWLPRLREALPEASFEPGPVSPLAILALGAGRPQDLLGVRDGTLVVQEEGSQLVALALGARAGERVLDACAGRGHKASLLKRMVVPEGIVDCADLHEPKLTRLREDMDSIGLTADRTFAVDWSVGSSDVPLEHYDAVLVDAPCTGTGTARRRPDILLRRRHEDVLELSALQSSILSRVAAHVRPGGRLVFAVCSVLREEAEDVIARVDLQRTGVVPAPFAGAPAAALFGDATTGRLLPHVHGTDGYFLASFVRP